MAKQKLSRLTVAVVIAGALILAAGGATVASNMGFKLNQPIVNIPQGGGGVGDNWVSLPYNNPYPTCGALCAQTGLDSTAVAGSLQVAQVTLIRSNPGVPPNCCNTPVNANCGTGACNALVLPTDGQAIRIKQTASVPPAPPNPTSIIIVGSHNPTLAVTVPSFCTGAGNPAGCPAAQGEFWFSVPYHTTAVTFGDLCVQNGLFSSGTFRTLGTDINPVTNTPRNANCGTAAAGAASLVLGRAVRFRDPNNCSNAPATTCTSNAQCPGGVCQTNTVNFIPAHF